VCSVELTFGNEDAQAEQLTEFLSHWFIIISSVQVSASQPHGKLSLPLSVDCLISLAAQRVSGVATEGDNWHFSECA